MPGTYHFDLLKLNLQARIHNLTLEEVRRACEFSKSTWSEIMKNKRLLRYPTIIKFKKAFPNIKLLNLCKDTVTPVTEDDPQSVDPRLCIKALLRLLDKWVTFNEPRTFDDIENAFQEFKDIIRINSASKGSVLIDVLFVAAAKLRPHPVTGSLDQAEFLEESRMTMKFYSCIGFLVGEGIPGCRLYSLFIPWQRLFNHSDAELLQLMHAKRLACTFQPDGLLVTKLRRKPSPKKSAVT